MVSSPEINPKDIETALAQVRDKKSFLNHLLAETLNWPIAAGVTDIDEISYEWSDADLRARELSKKLLAGRVLQVQLTTNQPWGIFILEFANAEVFTSDRGMTGILRQVLRGLVKNRNKPSSLPSWRRENLLFICTHAYKHFRVAHFKAPKEDSRTARLAAFGWGPDIPARTACEFNLNHLGWPRTAAGFDHWVEAFNVEKVTKKFYGEYRDNFDALRAAVKGLGSDTEDQKMFTQTLLNRLMFLRFIERKGWLTSPGESAGDNYLRLLFAAGDYRGKSFYNGRLRRLFFEGLAIEGKQESESIGKVPFLNGGLFEENTLDEKVADIPNAAFAPLLGPEGLFYRYNFTVQESTPLDVEVAVDPEMLGKVFEELVTGRHESGSYYTPRPVVSFMCREAIKGYLADVARLPESTIAVFVDKHDTQEIDIPAAQSLAAALDDLKAVDPACGSGAYLLGLLHEMVELYRLLYSEKLKRDDRSLHDLKLRIISNSIYGVDIDKFATNIAMLRLWLSLSVDSKKPLPLPNLKFKIKTGDSLVGPDPSAMPDLFREQLQRRADLLTHLKEKFQNKHDPSKHQDDEAIVKEERAIAKSLNTTLGDDVIDWRIHFAEVFAGKKAKFTIDSKFAFANDLPGAQGSLPIGDQRGGFDIVLANPPYVRQESIVTLKPQLKDVFPKVYSGTADLYTYFYARALQCVRPGGMLAFISSNKWFRAAYGKKLRTHIANTASVRTILDFHDLPVFESAIAYPMIFIASNRPSRNGDACTLVEPPTLDPPYPDVTAVVAKFGHVLPKEAFGNDGSWHLASTSAIDRLNKMRASGPTLGQVVAGRFFRGILTGLNEAWVDAKGRVYIKGEDRPPDAQKRGVFVLDSAERKALIDRDPKSAELIKPLVTGRDINRWCTDKISKWMIVTEIGVEIKRYAPVFEHLKEFQSALKARVDQGDHWWELRSCAYYRSFDKPKLLYPVITQRPTFALDSVGSVCNDKCYFIESDDRFLLAVLNSSPFWDFVVGTCSPLQGGFYEMRKNSLEMCPIPDASMADRKAIGALAQKCLDAAGIGCEAWEREIDERVAALYGIDLSDIEKSRPAPILDLKGNLVQRVIPKLAAATPGFPYFSLEAIRTELHRHLKRDHGSVEDTSLNRYLNELNGELLFDAGRSWYSTLAAPFVLDHEPVRELVHSLEQRFPLLEFSVWSTAQIAGYGHHQLAHFTHFVNTERDAMESVADALRDAGRVVYLDPDKRELGRNVRLGDGVIVIRPAVTKAPVEGKFAAIEKILVDFLIEAEDLKLIDAAEHRNIVQNAVSRGRISIATMLSYAERRKVPKSRLIPVEHG